MIMGYLFLILLFIIKNEYIIIRLKIKKSFLLNIFHFH